MKRQQDLFTVTELPQAPKISSAARRVLAQLGSNFAWWCRHGNREMCAAVLRHRGVSGIEAHNAVDAVAQGAAC